MLATNTIFIDLLHIALPKHHVNLQAYPIKILSAKVEKVKKRINYA